MSTDLERAGYRSRLREGDIVYFVEGASVAGTGELVTKKATVASTKSPDGTSNRRYPIVNIWDSPDAEPKAGSICTSKSPRALFTTVEVVRVLSDQVGPISLDARSIDELLVDPVTLYDLTIALGGATIQRLAQDELRRPNDPEY